jgi:hypothetical protein
MPLTCPILPPNYDRRQAPLTERLRQRGRPGTQNWSTDAEVPVTATLSPCSVLDLPILRLVEAAA